MTRAARARAAGAVALDGLEGRGVESRPVALEPGVLATPAACPACDMAPGYRRVPADPWDRHELCTGCGFCYLHDEPAAFRLELARAVAAAEAGPYPARGHAAGCACLACSWARGDS